MNIGDIVKSFFNYLIENRVLTKNLTKNIILITSVLMVGENFITFSNSGAVTDKVIVSATKGRSRGSKKKTHQQYITNSVD